MRSIGVVQGQVQIVQGDAPQISPVMVKVETEWSLISAGTESSMIRRGEESKGTFNLGYQAVGRVIEVGSQVSGVRVGDRVASYGAPYTRHAQVLAVPRTLISPVPEGVDPREAAFCGLGAISMHGLRLAKLEMGEVMVVQGLGVIGQLLVQMGLNAGFQVLASDPDPARREMAQLAGADAVASPEELEALVADWTSGYGADAVLAAAGSRSAALAKQALSCLTNGGRLVVVGDIPVDLPRELLFAKEAEVLVSRAGGPGRYDAIYEREGVDYPRQYVRWTEGRNVGEFIRLLAKKRLSLSGLISHEYALEEAPQAFEMILGGTEGWMGILLEY